MKVYTLTNAERVNGFTHLIKITHEDLTETTANTAQTFTLPVEDGSLFAVIATSLVEAFEDASDAAFNTTPLVVGLTGGDVDLFLASAELNENGTEIDYGTGAAAQGPSGYAFNAADTVDFLFTSMAAKSLSDLDTGELWVYYRHISLAINAPHPNG